MKKQAVLFLASLLFLAFPVGITFAQENLTSAEGTIQTVSTESTSTTVYFFHSITCPHCRAEQSFLNTMQEKYPELTIKRYEVSEVENVVLLKVFLKKHNIENMLGSVPLTFIGEQYILGYNDDKSTGRDIEHAIRVLLGYESDVRTEKFFDVPFFGRIYQSDFSLPILAVLLGFLDGFNVCSLGALMLIIGMTLKLQRRKTIILLGGTFILTTALVYGGLIVLWYKIFEQLTQYLDYVKLFITVFAFGGGLYFLKEYFRMRKQGAVCELQESKLINRLMEKTGKALQDNTKLLGLIGIVLLFAAVVAIVEFPCSAATPLIFAGILADSGLSTLAYLTHIGLFIIFYMLDEILIFAIAAYRLKLWMTSGTFTKYAVLAEALILIIIGGIYLNATFNFADPILTFFGF
jgi:glutaredoxin